MTKSRAVLFDLDGTLLDTAPDLLFALNILRAEFNLPPLSLEMLKPFISVGSKAMLKKGLEITESHPGFDHLRTRFLDIYQHHLADATAFYPGMEKVLHYLESEQIPWGIVTNKLTRHTHEILKALRIDERTICIVCGDTLTTYKPDPAPILHACEILKTAPQHCIYVGDSQTDVMASKAAGTYSLVALYGYIPETDDPNNWLADGYIHAPEEMIQLVKDFQ